MLNILYYFMGYFEILLALFSLLFLLCYFFPNKNGILTNWPFVGMFPAVLKNHHRIHDFVRELMEKSQSTFLFEGPWFTHMNLLVTADPANVHHVFSKNFGNYPKGSKFKEIFEVLGDGVVNVDSDIWRYHREMAQSFLTHPQFHNFLVKEICEKVETGLIPVLDHASKQGLQIDLQDLFERLTFDTSSTIVMGHDPRALCIDLPNIPASKAINIVEEAILYRHVVPTCVWKVQRWLCIGQERKYKEGWEILDAYIYGCLSKKREDINNRSLFVESKLHDEKRMDLISLYMDNVKQGTTFEHNDDKFLRDTILSYIVAGRDTISVTLSWFFHLLSRNPQVLSKIKEELDEVMAHLNHQHDDGHEIRKGHTLNYLSRNFKEMNSKLVYLHAALSETLRLYPPVAYEAKVPIESEFLPSGHKVDSNMLIIFSLYAMGRMKSIWGEDCYEFKPERWISEKGRIRHEPSYKFVAFNAGPRSCVGKTMAFIQMKLVASAIISNYRIQPEDGHPVIPDNSLIFHMKHGFKVKILTSH